MSQTTVDISIEPSDLGTIVRFMRLFESASLGRSYMASELIIVIDPALEQDLRADFDIYRQLEEAKQKDWLNDLRWNRYEKRRFSEDDLPQPEAEPAQRLEPETEQPSLF